MKPAFLTFIVFVTVIALPAIALNLLIVTVTIRRSTLQTVPNILYTSMAIADICISIHSIPLLFLEYFGLPHNKYGCVAIHTSLSTFDNIAVLMLVVMAIERFLAIRHPFKYVAWVTPLRAVIVDACVWALGLSAAGIPVFLWNKASDDIYFCSYVNVVDESYLVYFESVAFFLVPIIVMAIIYGYIHVITRKHAEKIAELNVFYNKNRHSQVMLKRYVHKTKSFVYLVVAFVLTMLPQYILDYLYYFNSHLRIYAALDYIANVLRLSNCLIDPILYLHYSSSMRRAIKGVFYKSQTVNMRSIQLSRTRKRYSFAIPLDAFTFTSTSGVDEDDPNVTGHSVDMEDVEHDVDPHDSVHEGHKNIELRYSNYV